MAKSKASAARRHITRAAASMPGLSSYLSDLSKPLQNCKISACVDINSPTALLLETLAHLGAQIHCCSANSFAVTDLSASLAAAISSSSLQIFLCSKPDLLEHWRCVDRCLDFVPDIILDDKGDLAYFLRNGIEAAEEKTGPTSCLMSHITHSVINETDTTKFRRIIDNLVGMAENEVRFVDCYKVRFPIIDLQNTWLGFLKKKFKGCRNELIRGLIRASGGGSIRNKCALVHGYDALSEVCIEALDPAVGVVFVTDYPKVDEQSHSLRIEDVVDRADFVVTTKNVGVGHMSMMKDGAVLYNAGGRVDMTGLKDHPFVTKTGEETWRFADTGTTITVVNDGEILDPSFAMLERQVFESFYVTLKLVAVLELWKERGSGKYAEKKIRVLEDDVVEKVAAIHMADLRAKNPKIKD